jgi:hypothetical protein
MMPDCRFGATHLDSVHRLALHGDHQAAADEARAKESTMNSNRTYVSAVVVERRANQLRQQALAALMSGVWGVFTGRPKAASRGRQGLVTQVLLKPQ